MSNPLPCYRCGALTWGTFGSLAYCAPCLRETRAGIRARIVAKDNEPEYAVGVLRCDSLLRGSVGRNFTVVGQFKGVEPGLFCAGHLVMRPPTDRDAQHLSTVWRLLAGHKGE